MLNVVIPAAGEGTRLRPLSSNVSKAMVPVNGKPTIAYIIEQVRKLADVAEIVIVDGKFTDIREFVDLRYDDVSCVNQGSLDGPRDAISKGVAALKEPTLPLVVWLGDAIILDDDLPLKYVRAYSIKSQPLKVIFAFEISLSDGTRARMVAQYSLENGGF